MKHIKLFEMYFFQDVSSYKEDVLKSFENENDPYKAFKALKAMKKSKIPMEIEKFYAFLQKEELSIHKNNIKEIWTEFMNIEPNYMNNLKLEIFE